MTDAVQHYGTLMVLLGVITLMSAPLKSLLQRYGLPGMIGLIGAGIALSVVDEKTGVLSGELVETIDMFAQIGIIALLFRVGLESDLDALLGQFRRAALIWLPNLTVAAAFAFALVWYWPGLGLVPAIITAIAASATSIGVSVAVWQDAGMIGTDQAALLLDVAELDDVSAVILLGVVFAIVPQLQNGAHPIALGAVMAGTALQIVKIIAFCAFCYGFSRVVEARLTAMFARIDPQLGPFIFSAGTVFLIAALADVLGFSVAVGAIFAGLAFSRDPSEPQIDQAFSYVLAIFGPFFFVSIGLSVVTDGFGASLLLAAALLLALIAGKLIGAGLPAALMAGRRSGALLGASMVPRAEIFLVVMLGGLHLGDWAVPQSLYTAAVLASVGTCLAGPLLVARLLAGHTPKEQQR